MTKVLWKIEAVVVETPEYARYRLGETFDIIDDDYEVVTFDTYEAAYEFHLELIDKDMAAMDDYEYDFEVKEVTE